jgi:hypothetical protein
MFAQVEFICLQPQTSDAEGLSPQTSNAKALVSLMTYFCVPEVSLQKL